MKVQDKVFVVTGGGGGIGGELVLALLGRGAKVAAVDIRNESLQSIKNLAGEAAQSLSIHQVDITDRKAVERLPEEIIQTHGQIDGIINNAGVIQPFVKVQQLGYDAVERVMNLNFYGTLYMTKAFLPHLMQRPEAYIANVSSMGGFLPVPGQSVYGASKAAVKLLTEGLYAELLNTSVHVSIVFPGATDTNITQNSHVDIPASVSKDAEKMKSRTLPAAKAAEIIIKGIEKNKPQIFTGSDSKMMNHLYRLSPVYATKFIARQMKSLLGQ